MLELIFDVASTDQHFEQILKLQKENLFSALSAERQAQQGFVFAEHNMALLKRFATELPQVIALSNDQVVGYNLGMPVSMRNEIASLVPMFDEFDRCEYKGKPLASYRYMVGGQVCVHKDFRGHGLLSKLYHETKNRLPAGYQLCVTEVAARNTAGINAHQKMGFEVVRTYYDGKELWKIVVWDLRGT
ncbi:GNAT family N-acetyltransferase [bacterium]|nr:GNAT family N-acetyltransferase [bacterium]